MDSGGELGATRMTSHPTGSLASFREAHDLHQRVSRALWRAYPPGVMPASFVAQFLSPGPHRERVVRAIRRSAARCRRRWLAAGGRPLSADAFLPADPRGVLVIPGFEGEVTP